MASSHGKDTDIYWGGYDLTGWFNDISMSADGETADTTTFGNSWATKIAGIKDGSFDMSGIFDGAQNAVDERLNATLGTASNVFSYYPQGDVQGNPAYITSGVHINYEVGASIGDAVTVSAGIEQSGGIYRALAVHVLGAETGTGNDTTSADYTTTTSTGFAANLHTTAFTGTSCTVKLVDSADNSAFADVTGGSFTAATGVTSQQLTHASTSVRRYVRTNRAGTFTSITYAVSLAKK